LYVITPVVEEKAVDSAVGMPAPVGMSALADMEEDGE